MAHPRQTRKHNGKVWHLEDSGLPKRNAQVLATHLKNTEGKLARVVKGEKGYEVWWARKG